MANAELARTCRPLESSTPPQKIDHYRRKASNVNLKYPMY